MTSSHGNTQSEPAKSEQIITEFFAKSLQIILESRCPFVSSRNFSGEQMISSPASSSSSSSSVRPRDRWFNLALKDCPAALENIDFWRQTNFDPMVVDIILVRRGENDWDPSSCDRSEKIIERWVVQYESRSKGGSADCSSSSSSSKRPSSSTSLHSLYKKSILLLRSLYSTVRLLPAYKLFRELNSTGQILTFNLAHRVSIFVEPFTHKQESEMQQFLFTPVETFSGRLSLSVFYHSSVSETNSEPTTPISPQFIQHYIGSPMADPLKRFPSLPGPSSFERRHSWSYDLYGASPPSSIPSPSPTHSDSRALIPKPTSHFLPPSNLPPQRLKSNAIYDEYLPSPVFSPSPSPSPPPYLFGNVSLLRSESAPLSIPSSRLGIVRTGASSRSDRTALALSGSTVVDKQYPYGNSESGRYSVVKFSSNSSPQKSLSGCSSRMSFQDYFDDSVEFSGPFVVDEDLIDPNSRPGSFDQKGNLCGAVEPGGGRKNQDAAVGALVCMLKKAPPLRQDLSHSQNFSSEPVNSNSHYSRAAAAHNPMGKAVASSEAASGHGFGRTTADALEELRSYREMKDLLVSQGTTTKTRP
ncbi:autophagy-related protein 13b [Impatiens glandulifera]|uniref:autophagy-related protein 13b n=1 Tax=Impatiens glandulifera TaxID=253017 RepID=UPI001FB0692F|nr:autophagy-related protein 13b [Impatiens glandulifera]